MKRAKKEIPSRTEDGSQQKISSFFQKPPANPESKLFTNVGSRSSLSLQKQKSGSSFSTKVYREARKENVCTTQKRTSPRGDKQRHDQKCHENISNSCSKGETKSNSPPLGENVTPVKAAAVAGGDLGSPDVVLIPDTPEEKAERTRPKAVARSFLRPALLLTTMPGKRPSPQKSKPKRVLKKSSGLVSVQFGKQKLTEHAESLPSSEQTESGFVDVQQTVDLGDLDLGEDPVAHTMDTIYTSTDCVLTGDTVCGDVEFIDDGLAKVTVTPTKVTVDGKLKRMAQSGLSPDAKQMVDADTEKSSNAHADSGTLSRAIKAKRQLAAMSGFKDVKDFDKTANSYQLGGRTREICSPVDVSCDSDDVLTDILGEMETKAASQKVPDTQPVTKPPKTIPHNENMDVSETDVNPLMLTLPSAQLRGGQCEHKRVNPLGSVLVSDREKYGAERVNNSKSSLESDPLLDDILGELQCSPVCQTEKTNMKNGYKAEAKAECSRTKIKPKKQSPVTSASGNHNSISSSSLLSSGDLQEQTKSAGKTEVYAQVSQSNKEGRSVGQHKTPVKKNSQDASFHLSSDLEDALAGSFSQMSPFKSPLVSDDRLQKQAIKFTDLWNRFTVQTVLYDGSSHELCLDLTRVGYNGNITKCVLQGFWADTHVEAGDTVHLLTDESCIHDDMYIISDDCGQIVVNPDLLLSGTVIVSGVHCLRRSVLNAKFKGIDGKNVHMLYGSIIHSLFQESVKNRTRQTEEIMATAQSVIQSTKFLHDMYGQNVTEEKVKEEIQAYIEPLKAWQQKYLDAADGKRFDGQSSELKVTEIHDIEETIWSPRYGVKGKIDLTVEVKIQNERGKTAKKVFPLELKTGKATYSVEHKGQVTLYSMMTSDRRDDPGEGLLLYLKHSEMQVVPVKPQNKQGLLQLRNEMAYYLSRQTVKVIGDDGHVTYHLGRLPHPINSHRSCSKCPHLTNCAIFQRSVEGLEHSEGHAMKQLVPEALSHLAPSHLSYFTHWLLCMDLETASDRSQGLRSIWCMSSEEREKQGDCLQQMVIVDTVLGVPETQAFSEGQGCCVLFKRRPGFQGVAVNTVGLSKNDSIVISSEDGRLIGLSTGFIKDLSDDVVEVVVDRDSFHENTAFQSLVFRIDRCDSFNTAGYLLSNLSRLMDNSPHCQRLRSLIIDGRKPEFHLTMSKTSVEKVKNIFKRLNKPQKTAILKVLMCKDYVLIKGYPGTGKTSTIVALVKILKELGQSVLLTSYTHSAVDNILLKLKKDGVPFLRLGRSSRIHPQIVDHAAETLTLDIKSVAELSLFYKSYAIVATSCLGTNHPVFTQRKFDVCIVDEASQVLQPACLGPLFNAERFVLVGDPQQLPPVVQSREAGALGMDESLFMRLDGAGATYDLNLQYRMNSSIMQLSNELVYKGALQCGSTAVAQACIQPDTGIPQGNGCDWLHRALDTSLYNAVVFFDTSKISAPEISDGKGLRNEVEARLILSLCTTFVQAGIPVGDIGIIAPYRSQVKYLQQLLAELNRLRKVEVNTVDQYQGRDKSVILISFVCSSSGEDTKKGGLLQDVRRLNVAVTRAKHKLVLVGNAQTLCHYQPVNALLVNIQNRQQMMTLPADFQIPSTEEL